MALRSKRYLAALTPVVIAFAAAPAIAQSYDVVRGTMAFDTRHWDQRALAVAAGMDHTAFVDLAGQGGGWGGDT